MPRSLEPPISVLFVCTANICRSAFVEELLRHLLADDRSVDVASAGVYGLVGQPVDDAMAVELRRRGVSERPFRSRRLALQLVDLADLVVTMEDRHRRFILDDRPSALRRVYVAGQLLRVLDRVPRELRGRAALDALGALQVPPVPDDDVADPYRRGPEAAAEAADRLEQLAQSLAARLRTG